MKKKLTLIVTAVALGALLAVGGTLAWFTDTETATNVVTTGNVDIAIYENGEKITKDNTGITFPENSTPGTTLPKEVSIHNVGNNDAYVRAQIIVEAAAGVELTDDQIQAIEDAITMKENNNWEFVEGKYYYTEIVTPTGASTSLMETIAIPTTWDNNYTDMDFNVKIVAEAIQADNNGANPVEAFGDAEIKPAN